MRNRLPTYPIYPPHPLWNVETQFFAVYASAAGDKGLPWPQQHGESCEACGGTQLPEAACRHALQCRLQGYHSRPPCSRGRPSCGGSGHPHLLSAKKEKAFQEALAKGHPDGRNFTKPEARALVRYIVPQCASCVAHCPLFRPRSCTRKAMTAS